MYLSNNSGVAFSESDQTKTPVGFEVEELWLDLRPDNSNDLSVFILCLSILLISMDVYSHNVQEQEICTCIRFLCGFKTWICWKLWYCAKWQTDILQKISMFDQTDFICITLVKHEMSHTSSASHNDLSHISGNS